MNCPDCGAKMEKEVASGILTQNWYCSICSAFHWEIRLPRLVDRTQVPQGADSVPPSLSQRKPEKRRQS
jgi:hypothetical protein